MLRRHVSVEAFCLSQNGVEPVCWLCSLQLEQRRTISNAVSQRGLERPGRDTRKPAGASDTSSTLVQRGYAARVDYDRRPRLRLSGRGSGSLARSGQLAALVSRPLSSRLNTFAVLSKSSVRKLRSLTTYAVGQASPSLETQDRTDYNVVAFRCRSTFTRQLSIWRLQ